MSLIDEDTATVAELSEELIFLIAAVSTDAQRKHAIDLFRRFSRLAEAEAFRPGQDSVHSPLKALPAPSLAVVSSIEPAVEPATETDIAEMDQPVVADHRISLIPPVSWQD